MKKSINAWSVDSAVGFKEMFRQLKAAGFDGVELNVDASGHSAHSLTLETTGEELAAILEISKVNELPVVSISTSLYAGHLMGSPKEEEREYAKKVLKKQLECAKALGSGGILVVPGGVPLQGSYSKAFEASLETLASLKGHIEEMKIQVGVENVWNGFFLSPFDMCGFIDRLDCPYIGAYYDVGNVIAFSWSEYWIDMLGGRIHHVHVKDFKRKGDINSGGDFVDLLKGDVNWPAVVPALRNAGFDGYLTAEVFKEDSDVPGQSYTEFYRAVSDAIDRILTY